MTFFSSSRDTEDEQRSEMATMATIFDIATKISPLFVKKEWLPCLPRTQQ
jgi:hypothetical protein